jgi:UTRA domain-containing protein
MRIVVTWSCQRRSSVAVGAVSYGWWWAARDRSDQACRARCAASVPMYRGSSCGRIGQSAASGSTGVGVPRRGRPIRSRRPFRHPADLYPILAQAGHTLSWEEYVRASAPTPDDTNTLHIPDGVPMLLIRRYTRDQHGTTLAMEETRLPGHDTQLAYTLTPTRTTKARPRATPGVTAPSATAKAGYPRRG